MQGTTSSGLSKTALFLTKTMFTFLIISVLIYLNFIDLQENNNNRAYMNLVKDVADKYHTSGLLFKDYELKRLDTLKVTAPQVFAKHYSSRVALVKTLNTYGAYITKGSKGGDEKANNTIMLMSNDSLRAGFTSSVNNPSYFTKKRSDYNDNSGDETINDALRIFNKYPQQEEVILLTAIDTALLARKCDSLLQPLAAKNNVVPPVELAPVPPLRSGAHYTDNKYHPGDEAYDRRTGGPSGTNINPEAGEGQPAIKQNALFGDYQKFEGLCVYKNEVLIVITDAPNDGAGGNIYDQKSGDQGTAYQRRYTIAIPAKTETVVFPSTLVFAGYPSPLVHELYDENRQSELSNEYGNAKLDMIDNISVAIYNKNNSPISILGFDLSRKWFPIALCIVITILSLLLFQTVSNMRIAATPIVADSNADDALHFLLNNRFIRFFLWVLASPVIMFLVFTSSPIQYEHWLMYILMFGCAVSIVLGIISYSKSLKM